MTATFAHVIADKMDEVEVNIWYEEEKQKLFDSLVAELGDPERRKVAEKRFHSKMDSLMQKYYSRMQKAVKSEAKRKKNEELKKKLLAKLRKPKKNENQH